MHIDWSTLALQTVNVLILIWLLARFLFRPVRNIIAERSAAAEKMLADAAARRTQAEADAAEVQQRLQNVAAEAERVLSEARAQAEAQRARLLQQAADAASHTQIEAKTVIENDRVSMERGLRPGDRHRTQAVATAAGQDSNGGAARIANSDSGEATERGASQSG
jgi:F-type H+-transporting ATPase subunit b